MSGMNEMRDQIMADEEEGVPYCERRDESQAYTKVQEQDRARHQIIRTALRLAAANWTDDGEAADPTPELEDALDLFDEALATYVKAATEASTALRAELSQRTPKRPTST